MEHEEQIAYYEECRAGLGRSSIANMIPCCRCLQSRITGARPTIGFGGPDMA
jgi:hypothetical protein